MTHRERIAVLNSAIDSVSTMHGSVTGDPEFPHTASPARCKCQYGRTIKGLAFMRRESYVAIQKAKKAVKR